MEKLSNSDFLEIIDNDENQSKDKLIPCKIC